MGGRPFRKHFGDLFQRTPNHFRSSGVCFTVADETIQISLFRDANLRADGIAEAKRQGDRALRVLRLKPYGDHHLVLVAD